MAQAPEKESFGDLLERSLAIADPTLVLHGKGDLTYTREPDTNQSYLVRHLLISGTNQKKNGLLEKSYDTFSRILEGSGGLTRALTHFTTLNLADLSVRIFDKTEQVDKKLAWIEQAYFWFDQLPEIGYDEESPKSRLHTAIQLAKLIHRHHFLVDSPEEKRELLIRGYNSINSVRDVVASNASKTWQFAFHSTVHLIVRNIGRFALSKEEEGFWVRKWHEEAMVTADISNDTNQQIKAFYLRSAAYAANQLAYLESNTASKLAYLEEAYSLITRVLAMGDPGADPDHTLKRRILASNIALNIADLTKDPSQV